MTTLYPQTNLLKQFLSVIQGGQIFPQMIGGKEQMSTNGYAPDVINSDFLLNIFHNCLYVNPKTDRWDIKPDYKAQGNFQLNDIVIYPTFSPVYIGHNILVGTTSVTFGNSSLQEILDPVNNQDCATKHYVDVAITNASNSTGQIENQFINQLNSEIARAQASENELKTYVDTTFSTIVNNNQSHQQIIYNLNAEIARARASEVSLLAKIDALYQFFLNTTSETAPTR